MRKYDIIVPCNFGLEAVLKKEIINLGYEIKQVEDGKVTFEGDDEAICRANLFLRSAERVLLAVGKFKAITFEELFESTKKLSWEKFIPLDGKFWVKKVTSIKSKLFSSSDIQSIVKKAIVERLKEKYNISWFEENGAEYPLRVYLMKDEVVLALDTSGEALHKRGYRQMTVKAPLKETLAAALIQLTPWKKDRILVDPFCGSGTFLIEAAMMGAKIAPGLNRSFTSENWSNLIPKKCWYDVVDEANDLIDINADMDIQGYDIDNKVIKAARENAKLAGVDHMIHFQKRSISELNHPKKYGFLITNPPYGERLEDKENLPGLYEEIGKAMNRLDAWSCYVITSYEEAEKYIGKKANKNRKLYNGMIKTYYYQFLGPKPMKKGDRN